MWYSERFLYVVKAGVCIIQNPSSYFIEISRWENTTWGPSSPPSCSVQVQLEWVTQGHLQSSWTVSKDADATVFLGNLAQCLTTLKVISFSLISSWNSSACVHCLLSCPCAPLEGALFHLPCTLSLGCCRQQWALTFSCPSPGCASPALSACLSCIWHCSLPVVLLHCFRICPVLGRPELDHCSWCSLSNARKREISRSLNLPPVLLLKQPGMLLAAFAARAHYWLTISLSTGTSRFFSLQIGFLASWPPACTVAWGYSTSEAGLCILVYWIVIIEFNVLSYNFVLVGIKSSEFVIWE